VFVEEIVVLLIQFVVEILLQAVVYLPFDFSFYRDEKSGERSGCGWMSVYLILGGGLGALSLLIAPRLLLDSIALRVGNLILAPLAAGGLSWAVSEWRRGRGAVVCPRSHFWFGFWFALAFGGVRLAYAAR